LVEAGNPLALSEMFSYPTIRTDQPDYPPGSPVIIYGTGWAPGEQVTLQIQEIDDDTFLADTADSTDSFTDTNFYVQDSHGGVTFLMTATGQSSAQMAQYKFTDTTHLKSVTVTPSCVNVTDGNTATYSVAEAELIACLLRHTTRAIRELALNRRFTADMNGIFSG
jgi:hypothetical protein